MGSPLTLISRAAPMVCFCCLLFLLILMVSILVFSCLLYFGHCISKTEEVIWSVGWHFFSTKDFDRFLQATGCPLHPVSDSSESKLGVVPALSPWMKTCLGCIFLQPLPHLKPGGFCPPAPAAPPLLQVLTLWPTKAVKAPSGSLLSSLFSGINKLPSGVFLPSPESWLQIKLVPHCLASYYLLTDGCFCLNFLVVISEKIALYNRVHHCFPHSSVCKESACNAGDPVSIPGSGRSPGEGNGSPLQYSCLENPMCPWGHKSQTPLLKLADVLIVLFFNSFFLLWYTCFQVDFRCCCCCAPWLVGC